MSCNTNQSSIHIGEWVSVALLEEFDVPTIPSSLLKRIRTKRCLQGCLPNADSHYPSNESLIRITLKE